MSMNRAYKGRVYPSAEYKQFKRDAHFILPKLTVPEGPLEARYLFGVYYTTMDVDNCIKAFQDILQEKYGFNDKLIMRVTAEKVKVKKGEEFIDFELQKFSPTRSLDARSRIN